MAADGLVVVDKPGGITSHDVVAKVRRLAGTRRVGHAGTLDPMATGVLVLGIGRATRLLGHLSASDKSYAATIRLGVATDTDDAEGEVRSLTDASGLSQTAVTSAMGALTGHIEQVPSAVSAVKVAGRRAYALAREGEHVQLAARKVQVSRFDLIDLRASKANPNAVDLDVEVDCGSGTYVRALARDLGQALQVGGHLTRLRRTRSGAFTEDAARSLDQLEADFTVTPMADAARQCFRTRLVDDAEAQAITHGRPLSASGDDPEPVAVLDQSGRLLALVRDVLEEKGPAAGTVQARSLAVFVG